MSPRARQHWLRATLLALAVLLLASCTRAEPPVRVLVIGNSLVYSGNLPGVLEGLAASQGHDWPVTMIAGGGMTLTQHAANDGTRSLLAATRFDVVVLQERGGDHLCLFGPESCKQAPQALASLRDLARGNGADVMLLGTYQGDPAASQQLVEAERGAANTAGLPYVAISPGLQRGLVEVPTLAWFAEDGMHPGADLALLQAIAIYHGIRGAWPEAVAFESMPPKARGLAARHYSAATVARVMALLKEHHETGANSH